MTLAEGHGEWPMDLKDTGQVPESFSASVPTSTVKNPASFTFSQSCTYIGDHVCVSGIHAHVCYCLDPQKGMQQPLPSAWSPVAGQECPETDQLEKAAMFLHHLTLSSR